jgi:hypothetical protein
MSFMVVRVEIGAFGEHVGEKQAVAINLPDRTTADAEAERLAKTREKHGYKREHGFWWFRDGERLFRLYVEG